MTIKELKKLSNKELLKPIKDEIEYDNTIELIGSLMNAKTGSREEEILDLLATKVMAYEDIHYNLEK